MSRHRKTRSFVRAIAALTLGLLIGVVFHYMLYRFSIPSTPFIYVAF